ncbi:hypothetical protein [Herbaspirillum robiniae]|uniref:hypothetical protein n=1 Tax=Herbaspirillum robiniae TaxID=2014887 RepID=UPI003D78ADDB
MEKTAREIGDGDVIQTSVQLVGRQDLDDVRSTGINPSFGVELLVENVGAQAYWTHVLQIFFCLETSFTVRTLVANQPQPLLEQQDRTINIFPVYAMRGASQSGASRRKVRYFLGQNKRLIPIPEVTSGTKGPHQISSVGRLVNSFPFSAWPSGEYTMREFLGVCIDQFIEHVGRYKDEVFPPTA